MKKNEIIALSVWLCFMLLIYAAVAIFTGCESGWSVAGWDV